MVNNLFILELVHNIKENGLLNPMIVRKKDKRYIEQYIIKAIIEYNKQNIIEDDNVIVKDFIF